LTLNYSLYIDADRLRNLTMPSQSVSHRDSKLVLVYHHSATALMQCVSEMLGHDSGLSNSHDNKEKNVTLGRK